MSDSSASRREFLRVGAAALAAGVAGCSTRRPAADPDQQPGQETTTATSTTPGTGEGSVYTRVYRETIDSVALVRAPTGQGTGWVYDDAHLVTNAHVVPGADEVTVRFHDGQWRQGDVVGVDAHSDLAVVEVSDRPEGATPLSLADSPAVVGQEVAAIGNPYDLGGSLTTGVVSGVDRAILAPTGYRIPDAVQTDAAINPGNSGGPLVTLDGRVVAVVNSGGGEDIAFGISAALARRVVPRLVETGEYRHSYIGLTFQEVTPAAAAANGLREPRGLLVVDVDQSGPSAGVLQESTGTRVVDGQQVPVGGDVVLEAAGTPLAVPEDLMSVLALRTRPGDTVELVVLRDGERRTVAVELGAREGEDAF